MNRIVQKTDNLSDYNIGDFIFCDELGDGIIIRDEFTEFDTVDNLFNSIKSKSIYTFSVGIFSISHKISRAVEVEMINEFKNKPDRTEAKFDSFIENKKSSTASQSSQMIL